MITIKLNQEVYSNTNYITCEAGEFSPEQFVMCKHKSEVNNNTVMFLASQVINTQDESSI